MSDKKIGIVTFNDAYNYGAFLQEYALQRFLLNSGYSADVLNYENPFFSQQYLYACNVLKKKGFVNKLKIIYNYFCRHKLFAQRVKQTKKFKAAIKNDIKLSQPFAYEKAKFFNDNYDVFLSGSDQVWNVLVTNHDKFYFLDFVSDNNKKKSYAASLGRSYFDEAVLDEIVANLTGFNNILIREESGKQILEKQGISSKVVLDPTFLLNRTQWLEFAAHSDATIDEKYIVVYIVAEQTNLLDVAIEYAEKHNCKIVFWSGKNRGITHNGTKLDSEVSAGPYEFIKYIANAECVFTTSFHGMALAINLNTDFYYELCRAKHNNNARLESVSKLLHLEAREIKQKSIDESTIDWELTNSYLQMARDSSIKELLSTIEGEVR